MASCSCNFFTATVKPKGAVGSRLLIGAGVFTGSKGGAEVFRTPGEAGPDRGEMGSVPGGGPVGVPGAAGRGTSSLGGVEDPAPAFCKRIIHTETVSS